MQVTTEVSMVKRVLDAQQWYVMVEEAYSPDVPDHPTSVTVVDAG